MYAETDEKQDKTKPDKNGLTQENFEAMIESEVQEQSDKMFANL